MFAAFISFFFKFPMVCKAPCEDVAWSNIQPCTEVLSGRKGGSKEESAMILQG